MKIKHVFLSVFLFTLLPVAIVAKDNATDIDPVKPSVSMSFSRQVIREDDSIEVELWVANNSDYQLLNTEMHFAGPDFLKWHKDSCKEEIIAESIALGAIDAHSVLRRHFCVTTASVIKIGEFNTLFTFKYQWQAEKGLYTSLVTFERPIKSNIFGSDNVAGIPLAFAGFIVPGLFFWFVINFFRAPWNVGVALGDKLIYSVLVSICIVGAGQWISLIDVSNGISINKLIRLALVGALLGAIVGSADYFLRRARHRRATDREIAFGDDDETLLRKLLQLNPRVKPGQAYVVRLKNDERYMGSMFFRTATVTSLVGWFKIKIEDQSPEVVEKIKALQRSRQLLRLFQGANRNGLKVEIDHAVQQWEGNDFENTGEGSKQWSNDQVAEIIAEADGKYRLPLRIAE